MVSDVLGTDVIFAATFNGEQDIYFVRIGPRDCNRNGRPDSEDLTLGLPDCDRDGLLDACEITADPEIDTNDDGVIDTCQGRIRRATNRKIPGRPGPATQAIPTTPQTTRR